MPILLSKDEWSRIHKWTDTNKEDPMAVRRREELKLMDERSKQMTKDWPNSVENVNKRNEEMRRDRVKATEEANKRFYERYVKRKAIIQERQMFEARNAMFLNKDAPKLLLSAVIETAVLKEREEQVKFNNEIKKRKDAYDHRDDKELEAKAKNFERLQVERKERRLKDDKANQKEILKQIEEVNERKRKLHEEQMNLEIEDNQRAKDEIEVLKQFDDKYKAAERARMLQDMEQARRDVEERRKEREARDALDERLNYVLNKSKDKIECRRMKMQREEKEQRLARADAMTLDLVTDEEKYAWVFEAIEKTEKAKEEKLKEKMEQEAKKKAALREERIADHKRFLKEQEEKAEEMKTKTQWDIMNRLKNLEIYEEFKKKDVAGNKQRIKEYREELLEMMAERKTRMAADRAALQQYYGERCAQLLRDADNRLLAHALDLIDEARRHQRPTYPIEKALDRYCKQNRLYAMPELYKSMQPAMPGYRPRDRSRPDPCYVPPAPPPLPPDHEEFAQPDYRPPPPAERGPCPMGGPKELLIPEYHQHGEPYKTLVHPDTDCFNEDCETGACHCEHHEYKNKIAALAQKEKDRKEQEEKKQNENNE